MFDGGEAALVQQAGLGDGEVAVEAAPSRLPLVYGASGATVETLGRAGGGRADHHRRQAGGERALAGGAAVAQQGGGVGGQRAGRGGTAALLRAGNLPWTGSAVGLALRPPGALQQRGPAPGRDRAAAPTSR